jgi:hypothetical protein
MLELIPVTLALGGVCVANYTDLKDRIIPNRLTYPLIGIGIIFYLALGVYRLDFYLALSGAAGAAIAFGIGYILWLTGGWAGGDVKLFTALGALLPTYTAPYVSPAYSSAYPLFPLTILFNAVIVVIPVLLIYVGISRIRRRGAFYEEVKITDLKEGMIPAETIYEKDGKIGRWSSGRLGFLTGLKGKPKWTRALTNPKRAAGVSRYQVGALRRLVREGKLKDRIRIKRGMPFAPALGVGVFIAVLYGDLYWRILTALTGA